MVTGHSGCQWGGGSGMHSGSKCCYSRLSDTGEAPPSPVPYPAQHAALQVVSSLHKPLGTEVERHHLISILTTSGLSRHRCMKHDTLDAGQTPLGLNEGYSISL
ncbi:unnamed protein product [Pleuronectes platessa]|uniref:Uncharacterized protein n=1 Tax=Pleuronectes platessa TaxID=8262 RepID=A0A9N7YN26_PLEPL|nr:unnamed protein product [Pleuronectes platessa]